MAIARKLLAVLLCMALFGCTSGSVSETDEVTNNEDINKEETEGGNEVEVVIEAEPLVIWSYTDEILHEIKAFEEQYNAIVSVEVMDMDGLVPMAMGVIKSGLEMPDMLILEESQLSSKQLKGLLLDLSEFSVETGLDKKISPYAFEKGRDEDDTLIGISYQVSPIGVYYRRSMALEAFSTDDPALIEEMFTTYSGLSGGLQALNKLNIKMFADIFTLRQFSDINNQWLNEAGLFNKENLSREYFELIKAAQFDKQVAFAQEWSDEWLQGMYKPISNAYGDDMKVFAYVLPSWALSNVLMLTGDSDEVIETNEDSSIQVFNDTFGDWALASLLHPESMGGSYMTINNSSEHIELSQSFIEYMMTDAEHDTQWLSESDMVSSIPAVQLKQTFPLGDQFLGGQNFHEAIGDIGQNINLNIYQDVKLNDLNTSIQLIFDSVITRYIQGDFHTIDEAIKIFETEVKEASPELFEVEVVE